MGFLSSVLKGVVDTVKNSFQKSLADWGTLDTGNTTDMLSYATMLYYRSAFQQAGGVNSNSFNIYDTPTHNYFRVLFHFCNGDSSSATGSYSGLLGPSWVRVSDNTSTNMLSASNMLGGTTNSSEFVRMMNNAGSVESSTWWGDNCAFSYLMMNGEYERAEALYNFINLLSNTSTYSPWYFSKVSGVDKILTREQLNDSMEMVKTGSSRSSITIEFLPDAMDNRMLTLLDLYRSAVYSNTKKAIIVPSNLRKFDMSLIIMSSPIQRLHHGKTKWSISSREIKPENLGAFDSPQIYDGADFATGDPNQTGYLTSYKIIELQGCEIDYNSSVEAYSNMDNTEGFNNPSKLTIYVDDAYEQRYNEVLGLEFGDLMGLDLIAMDYSSMEGTEGAVPSRGSQFESRPSNYLESYNQGNYTTPSIETRSPSTSPTTVTDTSDNQTIWGSLWQSVKDTTVNYLGIDMSDNSSAQGTRLGILEGYEGSPMEIGGVLGYVTDLASQALYAGVDYLDNKYINSSQILLGNLFGFSSTKLISQVGQLMSGNLWSTVNAVKSYKDMINGESGYYNGLVGGSYKGIEESIGDMIEDVDINIGKGSSLGEIEEGVALPETEELDDNMFEDDRYEENRVKLGNLFSIRGNI